MRNSSSRGHERNTITVRSDSSHFWGGTLFILAIAIGFAFGRSIVPSQDSSFLLYVGLVSGTLGMVILVVSMFTYSYSSPYASREGIKQGKVMSVYDAMLLHVYYPTWMRDWTFGWIPFIPIGALLLLGAIRHALASAFLLTIFYGGAVMLYQFLYARRWVAKQRNKEVV